MRPTRNQFWNEPQGGGGNEEERFLAELPEHLRDAALFMLNTGLRDQELCNLSWSCEVPVLELGTSIFIIPADQSKNGEERVVVLNRIAREVIERQRGKHPDRVFTYKGEPISRLLNTSWKRARIRAELPHLRVHDLRHTFATNLRAVGVSNEDRKARMGHKNGDVTTHYSTAALSRLAEIVELIVDQRPTILRPNRKPSIQGAANVGQKNGAIRAAWQPELSA